MGTVEFKVSQRRRLLACSAFSFTLLLGAIAAWPQVRMSCAEM